MRKVNQIQEAEETDEGYEGPVSVAHLIDE
jgi:hypothetical protein